MKKGLARMDDLQIENQRKNHANRISLYVYYINVRSSFVVND